MLCPVRPVTGSDLTARILACILTISVAGSRVR